MKRLLAITLLMTMGLITNQLPILWMSYQTYNQRYATFYCVNPGTPCQGSCTMKREFLERSAPAAEAGGIPSSVMMDARDLSPATLLSADTDSPDEQLEHRSTHPCSTGLLNKSTLPPTPPPRG